MVTVDEMHELLAYGHETRSFEVKGPGEVTDNHHRAVVARAVMAMGNLRDGGIVCVGINDKRLQEMEPGLTESQFADWSSPDVVGSALAPYCDPPVTFHLDPLVLRNGARVVAIVVSEFDSLPHICKRDFERVLSGGQMYVRSRRKAESVPVPSSAEMREVLDLATTKGVRDFMRRAHDAGLIGLNPAEVDPSRSDARLFDFEREAAWSGASDTPAEILSAAYSDLSIRPGPYSSDRIGPDRLEALLTEQAVRLRGWPLPFIDQRSLVERHGAWIGQSIEPLRVPHREAWRFCTSGQFLQRRVLATDMQVSDQLAPTQPHATGAVAVWDVLLQAVEAFELGTRLATGLETPDITVQLALSGIAGRELISGDWSRELHEPYITTAPRLTYEVTVETVSAIASPRAFGVELAQGLLRQFGLDVPDSVLFDWQASVLAA